MAQSFTFQLGTVNPAGGSAATSIAVPFSAQLSTDSPAFFLYPGTNYAIATHLDY